MGRRGPQRVVEDGPARAVSSSELAPLTAKPNVGHRDLPSKFCRYYLHFETTRASSLRVKVVPLPSVLLYHHLYIVIVLPSASSYSYGSFAATLTSYATLYLDRLHTLQPGRCSSSLHDSSLTHGVSRECVLNSCRNGTESESSN